MALIAILVTGGLAQSAYAVDESPIPMFPRPDVLMAGAKLLPGQNLTSVNGQYKLYVQTDGNMVVYNGNSPIWSSQTAPNGYLRDLTMRPDGNLVLSGLDSSVIWQSNTGGADVTNKSYSRYLRLTDSGKLVIHGDTGRPAWRSPVKYNAVRFFSRAMKNYSGRPMCMDVKDAGTGNGTNVHLWDCNHYAEGDAQSFVYNTSDQSQSIRMRSNQNKCIDFGGNASEGSNVYVWDCNGTNAQKVIYNATTGAIAASANTTQCLDISGERNPSDLNGTNILLRTCNGSGAQQFDMAVSGGTGIPIWVNSLSFVKHNATAKCIDVKLGKTENATNIRLWDCNESNAQNFSYNKIDGTIRMMSSPNKCMDLRAGDTTNSTNIHLWECNGGNAQQFDYDFQTGQIMLRKKPRKCVDVAGNSNSNDANIQLYECNNSSAQRFGVNGQLNSLSIHLSNVDDDVYVNVNGTQRSYLQTINPGLLKIEPNWLRQGDNEINVVLGNFGCGSSSLRIALYRNMERQPAMMRSVSIPNTLNCGFQADWKYTFNTETGRIRQTQ